VSSAAVDYYETRPRPRRAPAPARPDEPWRLGAMTPSQLLALQRTAGNQAVVARLQDSYAGRRGYSPTLVREIQKVVGVKEDGDYGPATTRAVAAWQRAHGLPGDGKAGPATLAAMGLAAETPAPAAATPEPAPEPAAEVPAAAPVGGDLAALMAKPRLSPDEMNAAREKISALPDAAQRQQMFLDLQAKVSYHSQRDNASKDHDKPIGDVMCNLTSLAMCLEYLGVKNPQPEMQFEDYLEKLRVEKVGKPRTDVSGWGEVAKLMGVQFEFVKGAGVNNRAWYEGNVKPHLAAGEAVMCSIKGHICRIQGMSPEGVVADDPYGHSTLLAGDAHSWKLGTNKPGGATPNAGEDITWPWENVEKHNIPWVAAFRR
jgi:hypothetical protein